MLRRLLAAMSIVSLLLGLGLLVFWWRSYHHVDHFSFGKVESNQTAFTTRDGMILVTTSQDIGGMISSRSVPYPFWRAAMGTLCIPALWVAITVRRRLIPPRPDKLPLEPR
jgi:hypothetical protein